MDDGQRTSWSAPDDHAPDASIYPVKAAGLDESLRRLESSFDRVYGEEEEVDRRPGQTTGLGRFLCALDESCGCTY